jgi:hypothetical protein
VVQSRRSTWSGFRFVPLLLAGLTTVGGCATEKAPEKVHPIEVLPPQSFTRAWPVVDLKLENDTIRVIDVRDTNVYVYADSKRVFALNRKSGGLKYSVKVASPAKELLPLVELNDKIVFPNDTALEIYDLEGNHERTVTLTKSLTGNASGAGEVVYFGSVGRNGGLVEAYDLADDPATVAAPFKWEYLPNLGGDVTAGTAVYNDVVYSASSRGEVDAVTTRRDVIWDTDQHMFLVGDQLEPDRTSMQSNGVKADLRADESGLYVASKDGVLFCINRGTGKLQWEYFSGAPLYEPPVLAADAVYLQVRDKGIVCLDKSIKNINGAPQKPNGAKPSFDRAPRWNYPSATQFLSQDAKYSYLAEPSSMSLDGTQMYRIVAVNKMDGKKAFTSDRDDFTVFGSNKKDNVIFAGFADGKIMAVIPVLKPGTIGELVMAPAKDAAAMVLCQR